jgi:hypothetical protein
MFNAKIKHWFTLKRCLSLLLLAGLVTMKLTGVLYAQSVTQAYGSDETLQKGMIVGLKEDDAEKVSAINVDQIDRILGVVVDPNDSPITISGEEERAFVATIGRYEVLVSDQQGEIKPTDYVTVSALNGIGMLAGFEQSEVLGRAVTGFNGKEGVISTSTLRDTKGNEQRVNIGKIELDIAVSKNPLAKSAAVTPEWLGKLGQAIAGKSLSPARLYISAAIFFVGAFIAGAILYAGIRSSIIAVGRNPLSKKSILRGLLQVIFTSLIVFIISVFGVYLLLKA